MAFKPRCDMKSAAHRYSARKMKTQYNHDRLQVCSDYAAGCLQSDNSWRSSYQTLYNRFTSHVTLADSTLPCCSTFMSLASEKFSTCFIQPRTPLLQLAVIFVSRHQTTVNETGHRRLT